LTSQASFAQTLGHLPRFLAYVFRHFPLTKAVVALTMLLLFLEYAVLSVMIPLSGAGNAPAHGKLVALWQAVAGAMRLPASQLTWLWFFLVLMALRVLAGYVHLLMTTWLSKQVHRQLSEKTFHRVLYEEPMAEIYRRSIGFYITLAGDDTFRAGTLINSAFQTLAGVISALAGFLLLYLFSVPVFWGTLGFLLCCAVLIGAAFRILLRTNQRAVGLSRDAGTAFVEALNSLRSIRSMASEDFVFDNYIGQIRRYVRLLFEIDAAKQGMKLLPALLLLIVGAVLLWPGSPVSMGLTASYFFAITTILIRIFMSLGVMMTSGATLLIDIRAAKDIDELTSSAKSPIPHNNNPTKYRVNSVELSEVGFGYAGGSNVLARLNFRFDAGHIYAIVGRSGSGKSTLADILLGLVQPSEGEVRINGTSAHSSQLRQKVVLVEQQARIFSTSVRQNLLLGLSRDDDEMWGALRAVALDDHVRQLPTGLDANFDYQGANLSGGQRQRLGIARALLRHPDVLILDEATSALDKDTRHVVINSLRERMHDKILIFITHEAEIAALADVVLKLDADLPILT